MPLLYNSGCKTREYACVYDIFCPKINPEGVVSAEVGEGACAKNTFALASQNTPVSPGPTF